MGALKSKNQLAQHALAGIVLIPFAFFLAFYFSGQFWIFDTSDDSLITNPAWRMVNGQIPFRDFGLIQGLTPALFEALFIASYGATLKALIIHVSVINATATLISYTILIIVGLSRVTAFVFAALTAIIFYPPQGLAFSVQHGSLMMMVALMLALMANYSLQSLKASLAAWLGCGLAMGFAYLSKQTLGLFLPGILVLMLLGSPRRFFAIVTSITIGGSLPFVILYIAAGGDNNAAMRMLHYLVIMPWEFGGSRLGADLNEALVIYELAITPTIVASIAIIFASAIILFNNMYPRGITRKLPLFAEYSQAIVFLVIGIMWLIGNISIARIHHWDANLLLQSIFLSAGIILAGFLKLTRDTPEDYSFSKREFRPIVLIFCFIAIYDGWWAYANIVKHRGVRNIDSVFSTRLKIPEQALFPEIKDARFREFIQRQVTENRIDREHIQRDVVLKTRQLSFLRSFSENYIIHGFSKIIQIFAGKVDPLPVVAIQPGASSAYRDSDAFPQLISDLERNIVKFDVRGLILSKNNFNNHKAYIETHPEVFCNLKFAELAVIIKFCPQKTLPQKYGNIVGQVINLDGDLYR